MLGGGLTATGSALTLTSSTVSHNTASGDGGGLEVYSGTLTLTKERDHRVPYAFVINRQAASRPGSRARGRDAAASSR
jgi:hypothetical protein